MPDADDLFRPTAPAEQAPPTAPAIPATAPGAAPAAPTGRATGAGEAAGSTRAASGRVKHDEKMTVYVTADELHRVEDARLALRRHHGLAVDRGRLVREAVALVLDDLDSQGADSPLVRRLTEG
nr:hypothetical protein [Nocardioides perillae]